MSAMSAAAQASHLQQQQQQQQQRMVHPGQLLQQGTPTMAADKRSRWMAENYSQNIYAVSVNYIETFFHFSKNFLILGGIFATSVISPKNGDHLDLRCYTKNAP